ncbi:AaceriACR107Wp [[Ashbya] aceris (nom. inval.)]|nr:AaceriACR107Wp [[Ashbya] aceris (nom. inval.)]
MSTENVQTDYASTKKRKKVVKACVFCRRSHMICDDRRPCSRCIKRDIGHLCCDEKLQPGADRLRSQSPPRAEAFDVQPVPEHLVAGLGVGAAGGNRYANVINHPKFVSEHIGSEFSSLNEFLTLLEDPLLMEATPSPGCNGQADPGAPVPGELAGGVLGGAAPQEQPTARENFFLTAADPSTEVEPEDRLKLVINAKLEAGLLQPYNYSQGYARLQNYMDKYMNQSSRQRILKPLSTIRPAFRAIARSLKDVDLVLVEEGFERMLLSYDRVFTSMSMPACLWRRTGEIYRGNKEFASLVDCTVDDLRDGNLAIYELMTEESAVNFWEKYGSIAFDKGQKAVLTSCNLRSKDGRKRRPCCFSFTIRRDRYNIPICIIGNFIPIS